MVPAVGSWAAEELCDVAGAFERFVSIARFEDAAGISRGQSLMIGCRSDRGQIKNGSRKCRFFYTVDQCFRVWSRFLP